MSTRARLRWAAALTAAVALAVAGCGDDDDGSASTTTERATTTATATSGSDPSTTTAPSAEHQVRSYFVRGEELGPVARTATDEAVAAGAIAGLLAGPTAAERELGFATAIPEGTRLLGIVVEGGVATVDLTGEFASGGGSLSMSLRVAQVVFTLTQFPTVRAVDLALDGEPLTVLGGEGLILDEPQTRADWEDHSPAILVESPLPFADVESPLVISGTANTFEAMFRVSIVDAEGLVVYDEPAMATSGTGTRGTFELEARFEPVRHGLGAVIVFEPSARDGSPTNVVEIPVHL